MSRVLGLIFGASIAAAVWAAAPGCTIDSVSESGHPCGCDPDAGFVCDSYDRDGGLCRPPHACDGGHQDDCGGSACADLDTDPANCGRCGNICPAPGKFSVAGCEAGHCVIASCDFLTEVDPADPDAGCKRGISEDLACGSEHSRCAKGFRCGAIAGHHGHVPGTLCFCEPGGCAPGSCESDAGIDHGGGRCFCGAGGCVIGEGCAPGGGCSCNGGDACQGPPSTVCCQTGCADLATDPENCLACGARCPPGFICAFAGDFIAKVQAINATGGSACKCQNLTDAGMNPCQASKGAIATCDEDTGVCLCGKDQSPCLPGQRCTLQGCL